MATTKVFDRHVIDYEKWYEDYPEVYQSEILALREQLEKLPENIQGIEVGLGTGRFAGPLGIKEGIEPSETMAAVARDRGIEVMKAVGERLPYGDLQFDFVLYVTICYLQSVKASLKEAYRVLKKGGALILGFLDKNAPIAKEYKERGSHSKFFANAQFYTPEYVEKLLGQSGFRKVEFNQTLFGKLKEINQVQTTKDGFGEGSFVVATAWKR